MGITRSIQQSCWHKAIHSSWLLGSCAYCARPLPHLLPVWSSLTAGVVTQHLFQVQTKPPRHAHHTLSLVLKITAANGKLRATPRGCLQVDSNPRSLSSVSESSQRSCCPGNFWNFRVTQLWLQGKAGTRELPANTCHRQHTPFCLENITEQNTKPYKHACTLLTTRTCASPFLQRPSETYLWPAYKGPLLKSMLMGHTNGFLVAKMSG